MLISTGYDAAMLARLLSTWSHDVDGIHILRSALSARHFNQRSVLGCVHLSGATHPCHHLITAPGNTHSVTRWLDSLSSHLITISQWLDTVDTGLASQPCCLDDAIIANSLCSDALNNKEIKWSSFLPSSIRTQPLATSLSPVLSVSYLAQLSSMFCS